MIGKSLTGPSETRENAGTVPDRRERRNDIKLFVTAGLVFVVDAGVGRGGWCGGFVSVAVRVAGRGRR